MKIKRQQAALLVSALLVAATIIAILVKPRWQEHKLMRESEPIQASLESYRQTHGQYPESLTQIGISGKLEGPIFYRQESRASYLLWFGTSLGESRTFDSTDHKWH